MAVRCAYSLGELERKVRTDSEARGKKPFGDG